MITLEFERGRIGVAIDSATGGELGLECFEQGVEIVGAIGALREATDDGDPLAAALFALDAEGLIFGVEGFAAGAIARAHAGGDGLAAAFAGDGLFEGCAVKESGHGGGFRSGRREA